MRAIIEKLQPDVMTFQELDHFADCSADLRALGYECSVRQPAGSYKSCHAAGVGGIGPAAATQYVKHLDAAGLAFAPKTNSNAIRFSLERGYNDPDDDGVAIFWRASAFRACSLSFLAFNDAKRCQGVVRVKLERKEDSAPLFIICAHLAAGTKKEDEADRLLQIRSPTIDPATGQWQGPSLLSWLRESANEAPTVFCLDANSAPTRTEPETVWMAFRQLMPSVWDRYFDAKGKATASGAGVVVTSNKLRGPESTQLKKIGEHVCLISDYIYFSPHLSMLRHAIPPATYSSEADALRELLPSLSVPSDHMPVACDFDLPRPAVTTAAAAATATAATTLYTSVGGLTWRKTSFGAAQFASPAALSALLAELNAPDDAVIGCLKGYGSGLPILDPLATNPTAAPSYVEPALRALEDVDVLLFDGDWHKPDAFTALVPLFLRQRPSRRCVAFRKPTPNEHAFYDSWDAAHSAVALDGRLALVEVCEDAYDNAMRELASLGTPEADLNYTSLGWLTLTHTRCVHALAVGGGATAANEAKACVAKRERDGVTTTPRWTVLDVSRATARGKESPAELVSLATALAAPGSGGCGHALSGTLTVHVVRVACLDAFAKLEAAFCRVSLKETNRMRFSRTAEARVSATEGVAHIDEVLTFGGLALPAYGNLVVDVWGLGESVGGKAMIGKASISLQHLPSAAPRCFPLIFGELELRVTFTPDNAPPPPATSPTTAAPKPVASPAKPAASPPKPAASPPKPAAASPAKAAAAAASPPKAAASPAKAASDDGPSAEEAASFELRGQRARPRKKIEYAPVRDVTYLKPPGSCNTKWKTDTRSIDFQAECVEDSKIYVLDPCSQVSVAECKGCRVVIGPVSGSVFLIELTDCIVSVAAKQIRLRDCQRCELRVFCPNKEGLIIETSDSLTIGAWDVEYPELGAQCASSGFSLGGPNYWNMVYDFSPDPSNAKKSHYTLNNAPPKRVELQCKPEGLSGGSVVEAPVAGSAPPLSSGASAVDVGDPDPIVDEVRSSYAAVPKAKQLTPAEAAKAAAKANAEKAAMAQAASSAASDAGEEEAYLEDYEDDDFDETMDEPIDALPDNSDGSLSEIRRPATAPAAGAAGKLQQPPALPRNASRSANPSSSPSEAESARALAKALDDYDDAEELEEIDEEEIVEDFDDGDFEDDDEEEAKPPADPRAGTRGAVAPTDAGAPKEEEEDDDDGAGGHPPLLSRAAAAASKDPQWATVVHGAIQKGVLRFSPQYAGQVIAAHTRFQETVEEALDGLLTRLGIEHEDLALALIGTSEAELKVSSGHRACALEILALDSMDAYEALMQAEAKAAASDPVRKVSLAALSDESWQRGVADFVQQHAAEFGKGLERQPTWATRHMEFQEQLEGALEDVLSRAGIDPTAALSALCNPSVAVPGITPLPVQAELPLRAFVDYDAFEEMMRALQ